MAHQLSRSPNDVAQRVRRYLRHAVCMYILSSCVAFGQQMIYNISVYSDATLSADFQTIYGVSTTVDQSSGCYHSGYATTSAVYGPNGPVGSAAGGMVAHVNVPTNGVLDSFRVVGAVNFTCSCYPYGPYGAGGAADVVYSFNVNSPASLYSAIAALSGKSAAEVEAQFVASGVLNNAEGAFTSDNLNILALGSLASNGDSVNPEFESYVQQLGYSFQSATTIPASPGITSIPALIRIFVTAANPYVAGAIVLGSVLFMTGDHPARWDPARAPECEAQQVADVAECSRRFPPGSGQRSKLSACITHSWDRHSLCMKGQPVPPLQPQN